MLAFRQQCCFSLFFPTSAHTNYIQLLFLKLETVFETHYLLDSLKESITDLGKKAATSYEDNLILIVDGSGDIRVLSKRRIRKVKIILPILGFEPQTSRSASQCDHH